MLVRALVVEADLLQSDLLVRLLEPQGFYVEVAENGLAAIRKMLVGWFDLVLMDYQIPELDGLAAGRIITDLTREFGRPRLIALSATPLPLLDRLGERQTVFDAIESKPWNPQSLLATIRRCLESAPPARHRQPSGDIVTNRLGFRDRSAECGDAGGSASILVVEDDEPLRTLLRLGLEAQGYRVGTAENGLDALRKLARTPYDVVVVDYQMPELDGLATARLIFELVDASNRPRVVALTSVPERLSQHEGDGLSVFDEIIAKSQGLKAVLAAVQRCAEYRRLRTETDSTEIIRLDAILKVSLPIVQTVPACDITPGK